MFRYHIEVHVVGNEVAEFGWKRTMKSLIA